MRSCARGTTCIEKKTRRCVYVCMFRFERVWLCALCVCVLNVNGTMNSQIVILVSVRCDLPPLFLPLTDKVQTIRRMWKPYIIITGRWLRVVLWRRAVNSDHWLPPLGLRHRRAARDDHTQIRSLLFSFNWIQQWRRVLLVSRGGSYLFFGEGSSQSHADVFMCARCVCVITPRGVVWFSNNSVINGCSVFIARDLCMIRPKSFSLFCWTNCCR